MKNLIKTPLYLLIFPFGLIHFVITGKTSNLSYISFRHLFVVTNGRINDMLSAIISIVKPKKSRLKESSVFGNLNTENKVEEICEAIRRDGFCEIDVQLPEQTLERLVHLASNTGARQVDLSRTGVHYKPEKTIFNPEKAESPRYQFATRDIIQDNVVQDLILDPAFYSIATNYLNCEPILDIATMWWSAAFHNEGTAQSAQMYHFDMDRLKFIKFFFYLTDVNVDNGPHCYVRNSHIRIPSSVRKDRRITDEEITKFYPREDILEFTGPKGTILAVDTRGLHKGKSLNKGNRLLFQIQFSNSLFGAPTEPMKIESLEIEKKKVINTYQRTYQLLT